MIPGLDPIGAIVGSQYLQGLFLPIVLAFIVKLASSRALLGVHASPRWLQAAGWGAVVLLFVLNAAVLIANLIGVGA
jgi:manganese transport protein